MGLNVYSLADHIVTITIPDDIEKVGGISLSIGGPGENGNGSFVGEISVSRNKELWDTAGDNTGSWVHNQNLDRTGKVDIRINQVSDNIIKLAQLCNIYEGLNARKGLTITVSSATSDDTGNYAECYDCYPTRIPEQRFGSSAQEQSWSFTVGQVVFPLSTKW